jgi:two-component system, NarL family, sensor kinase
MFGREAACRLVDGFCGIATIRIQELSRLRRFPSGRELLFVGSIAAFQQFFASQENDWRTYVVITALFIESILIGFLFTERSRRRKVQEERDRAHNALRESEEKNRAILTALPDLMFLLDENGTYLDWYAADVGALYAPPEQFLGRKMREILPPELAEPLEEHFHRVLESGEPSTMEYSLVIRDRVRFFETRIVKCGQSKLLSIVREVTERKYAETELQQLSSRLLSLQDDERRRIARELHDGTAQNLFAISVNLENLQHPKVALTSGGLELVKECQELCEDSLREVRTLSYVIHPPALDRVGLIPTLEWYIDAFVRRSGIKVQMHADKAIGRLPLEMEMDLFRIVQEGLSNVVRHSGGNIASVLIERRKDQVVLQIKDNGRGMPRGVNADATDRVGIGIPSMRERLRRLGGQLEVKSAADGVALVARVPVSAEREPDETSAR